MKDKIVFPNWMKIAENIMQDNPWVMIPFQERLAQELEHAFNQGKAYGHRIGVDKAEESERVRAMFEKVSGVELRD